MMELAMQATQENAICEPDPQKLLESIYPSLILDGGVVGIVGEPGGRIEGAILLRMGNLWYSSTPILEERALFVHPEFRAARGGRFRLLVEFAKSFANSLNLVLAIGVLSSSRTEAKSRGYERLLGSSAGTYFLWNGHSGLTKEAAE